MEQTAYFIRRPRRIEELRAEEDGRRRPYRIVSSLHLGGMDYENFVTDLLADRAFLENVPGCGEDGNVLCCLRVLPRAGIHPRSAGRDRSRSAGGAGVIPWRTIK